MMHEEFEKLAGYEVSSKDYSMFIEPMYMALNVSKEEFVKMIDKKRFALKPISSIIKSMKKLSAELKESCNHFTDFEKIEELENLVTEYLERKGWIGDWGKIACFTIETARYFQCNYPHEVIIYSSKTFETMERIELA